MCIYRTSSPKSNLKVNSILKMKITGFSENLYQKCRGFPAQPQENHISDMADKAGGAGRADRAEPTYAYQATRLERGRWTGVAARKGSKFSRRGSRT